MLGGTLDFPDVFYIVAGLAFLGLTFQPAFRDAPWFNLPLVYILAGAALSGLGGLPIVDPMAHGAEGGLQTEVVTHVSELIVIVSLAGTGLAIDLREGWRRWQPTWRLLGIAMPLTILALAWMGYAWMGLGLASAILLAGSLAPTDPVLARSVQVGPPGEGDGPTRVALTAEAGLNDGLAFPFIWLAIAVAGLSVQETTSIEAFLPTLWSWFSFDVVYRIAVALGIGWGAGWAFVHLIHSSHGDGSHDGENAALMVMAATFISYGLTEAVDGYGFLAVFVAARVGRALTRGEEEDDYNRVAHGAADQIESILLAIILLWLGTFVGAGLWREWGWGDLAFALAFIFVVRPIAGWIALLGHECHRMDRYRIAFFGVRGMGSVFYIAYGQTHALFPDMDAVWRIAALVIVVSVIVHGFSARLYMREDPGDEPAREADPSARADRAG